jgi:predicted DCC family thiol-disulfide oxidoreductase YuxK
MGRAVFAIERRTSPGSGANQMETQQLAQDHSLSEAGIDKPVIFFDDVCIMCNTFVNLLLRVDRSQQFLFAPLHGETASKLLPPLPDDPTKWLMIYVDERGIHDQSDASLEVCRRLGGFWWFLSLARFIPRAIRNPIYRVIARNRYRWFGKRDACRIPSPEERARFLE